MNRFAVELGSESYPESLLQSESPPKVLYGMGDRSLLSVPTIGIIGARKATPYGIRASRLFAEWIAASGLTVVSGAAIGCDQAAQMAALDAGGRTIAVLGCGCDVDYPSGSSAMLKVIREKHLVVSEREWGARPARWALRVRNRIIAALSHHLLVVEAGLPSGTFSTVDYKLNGTGMVFVVPGSIFSPSSRGCNRLISQGAIPLCDVSDLSMHLGLSGTTQLKDTAPSMTDLSPVHRALLAEPMRPDDIAYELGLDILSVARILSEMESAGTIYRNNDGRYGLR
ncbi:MAG: DNA-protecting protein DprA [Actinobacteria bacterium]|nr:DNA-protecting protein DprA [Actinomycetota bacterium]MCL5887548.1 DNA-protecting protein DprA [Actinomycetota bacterium]